MTKTTTRTTLVILAVLTGMIVGSPLAVSVAIGAVVVLYRLVDYSASEVERGLEVASRERVAQLTWELRTAAAQQALSRRRLLDQRDRGLQTPPYAPQPSWPTSDPDQFVSQLETMLVPAVVPVPPEPEPVVYRGPEVDEILFANGGLLCIPAALRLYRYADAP
jgi:hypothetical protein